MTAADAFGRALGPGMAADAPVADHDPPAQAGADWALPSRAGRGPSALVIAAFPPSTGAAGALGASIVVSLARLGYGVLTVTPARVGGDVHRRLDFAMLVDLKRLLRELSGRRFDVVVIDPGVFRFRRPRRFVHLVVAAHQFFLLFRLSWIGRKTIRVRRRSSGSRPQRFLANALFGLRGAPRLDPAAPFAARHARIARILGRESEREAIAPGPEALAAALAGLGPGDRPRRQAAEIAEAACRSGSVRLPTASQASEARRDALAPGGAGGFSALSPDPVAVAEAPDPHWSAGPVTVTRLMVHMRAALRALPRLKPGTPRAAKRLIAWYNGPLRNLSGRGMPDLFTSAAATDPAGVEAAIDRRIVAWWSDVALHGGLVDPIKGPPPLDAPRIEEIARGLSAVAAAALSGGEAPVLPDGVDAALSRRVMPEESALSGFEFGLGLMSGGIAHAPDSGAGWRAVEARRAVARLAADAPWVERYATPRAAGASMELSLIGFARDHTGLSENLAMTRAALARSGFPTVTRSIELGLARIGPQASGEDGRRRLNRPVRLLHVNADLVPQVLVQPVLAGAPAALNIGFLLWEFGVLPEAHRLALDMLDEAWCPSTFVADAYRATGRLAVHRIGKAVTLGEVEDVDRASLDLPADDFVFLLTFDFHSSVERKNPLAAVAAFQRAFPGNAAGVSLVIKTTEPKRGHWGDPGGQWQRILDAARHDPRIRILTGVMPRGRYFALMAAADCLVSPHRAEGFGYSPAQAMLLGKPVISTDWSGTRDFCTPETSFPVQADLIPVKTGETIFPISGAVWAAIDEDALAETMRRVVEDRADAGRRAAAGQALIRRDYSIAAQAARYLDRLTALGVVDADDGLS